MNTILCTYPRSGSRYLSGFLLKNTDLDFDRSHNANEVEKYENAITTIRMPKDCFKSQITLEFEFQKLLPSNNHVNDNLKNEDGSLNLEKSLNHCISMYIKFYEKILKHNPIIINYNKILEEEGMRESIDVIKKRIDFNVNENFNYDFKVLSSYSKMDEKIFMNASKSEKYKEVSDFVEENDLEEVNKIYNEIIYTL